MKILGHKNLFSALMLSALMLLTACSDPQFGAIRGQDKVNPPLQKQSANQACSNFSLIRPKVDLLFVWDNSSSSVFINNETKKSLRDIVKTVSSRFDYHIVLAPLIRNNRAINSDVKLVAYDTAGLNSSALSMLVNKQDAADNLSFPIGTGSKEPGLERTRELIASNIANGIFRSGAYTIVVLMSTEDDDAYMDHFNSSFQSAANQQAYADIKINQLLCLRGNHSGNCSGPSLNSSMMRFISIVANNINQCSSNGIQGSKVGRAYQYTSKEIYTAPYTDPNIDSPSDAHSTSTFQVSPFGTIGYDTVDICQKNYRSIFDGLNNVIQDTIIKHKYDRWPIAAPTASIDLTSLKVIKCTGINSNEKCDGINDGTLLTTSTSNGYQYIGNSFSSRNTRYEPSPGEAFTGHMIQLYGSGRVTYPECIKLTFLEEREYFGFVVLSGNPHPPSIELRINGNLIPICTSASTCANGWLFDGYQANKNIKVVSPTNTSPASPTENRTGYFLKLFGSAIYTNGDNVNVNWLPSGN